MTIKLNGIIGLNGIAFAAGSDTMQKLDLNYFDFLRERIQQDIDSLITSASQVLYVQQKTGYFKQMSEEEKR